MPSTIRPTSPSAGVARPRQHRHDTDLLAPTENRVIGAGGVGGSAVHIALAAVEGKAVGADIDAQKRAQIAAATPVANVRRSEPSSLLTRRWRKPDSNLRYRGRCRRSGRSPCLDRADS